MFDYKLQEVEEGAVGTQITNKTDEVKIAVKSQLD